MQKLAKNSQHSHTIWNIRRKVLGIINSVINALLPTSIFWEMKQNQKHQSRNIIIPLVECLLLAYSTRVFPLWKFLDGDPKAERPELFSSWKNKDNTWQQIESQAKRMCLDRLHRLVKNKDLFAAESKYHPSRLRSFRAAFANHNSKSQMIRIMPVCHLHIRKHLSSYWRIYCPT